MKKVKGDFLNFEKKYSRESTLTADKALYPQNHLVKLKQNFKLLCQHSLCGVQGQSPCKKDGVILRRASADRSAAEGSRAAPIYKRGAEPARGSLMCITVNYSQR